MKRPTMASRRPLERGQFSWVSMVLLVGLISTVYMGWVWIPVYASHQDVKTVVRKAINEAVHNNNDAKLVAKLCQDLAKLGQVEVVGADGTTVRVPEVDVAPSDVTWERDTSPPPTLHVAFEYVRLVKYPIIDRTEEVTFSVDFDSDISVPKW